MSDCPRGSSMLTRKRLAFAVAVSALAAGCSSPTPTATTVGRPTTADVSVTGCTLQPVGKNTFGHVTGQIVNHQRVSNDYTITVTLFEGSSRVGQANNTSYSVEPRQTQSWAADGLVTGGNGTTLRCQLATFERTRSTA